MCRSIKTLRRREGPPTDQEIHEAALQFVRKISGYRVPSRVNTPAFEAAVREVSASSRQLLTTLASNHFFLAMLRADEVRHYKPGSRVAFRYRRYSTNYDGNLTIGKATARQ